MARPYQTRSVRRPFVSVGEQQQPQLQVVAPEVVRTPGPETTPLAGLAQILGIANFAIGKNVEERNKQDYAQGIADEKVGAADAKYAKHHSEYARGAFETVTLEQYQAAEQKVTQKATEDLDHSLPIDEQVSTIDSWMKAELGSLITDPRARTIIGTRYQQFIQTAAANIQKAQLDAHAQAALDATVQDVTSAIDRGHGLTPDQWTEAAHRIISQTGDPSKANQLLVGSVAQAAEDAAAAGDPNWAKIYDSIPTKTTGTDGSTLPGPMYHPQYRGIVEQSKAKAEQLFDKHNEEKYAGEQFHAYVDLDQDLSSNVPITMETLAAKGYKVGTKPGDTLSPSVAAQYIQQSQIKIAAAQAKANELGAYDQARNIMGRWADVRPAVADYSDEKRNDAADAWFERTLVGGGATLQQLGGVEMAKNPDLVRTVAILSSQEGVPYRPLRDTMSSVNQFSPGDVTARLQSYRILKERGLAGMYVTDDAALLYEKAISAANAGEKPEGIADSIRTMGDKDTSAYVSDNMRQSKLRKTGVIFDTGGGFLNYFGDAHVNSLSTLNAPQISARLESLTMRGLEKGLSLTEAEEYAKGRIAQTHTPIKVDGKWAIVPNDAIPGGNARAVTEALDWYVQALPALSKARGIPADEDLEVRPTYGLGRQLEFEVTRAGGVEVPKTRFSISGLMEAFYKAHPEATPQGKAKTLHDEMVRPRPLLPRFPSH